MSEHEVKFGLHTLLAPKPEQLQTAHALLRAQQAPAAAEVDTLQWFAFKVDDTADGAPGAYGTFATFADEATRAAHLEGDVHKALTDVTDELLAGPALVRPVEVFASKIVPPPDNRPLYGTQVTLRGKERSGSKIRRIIMGQYFQDVKDESITPFWYAFQIDASTFGLFAVFHNVEDRQNHLNGHAVMHMLDEVVFSMEGIDTIKFDVVAYKT